MKFVRLSEAGLRKIVKKIISEARPAPQFTEFSDAAYGPSGRPYGNTSGAYGRPNKMYADYVAAVDAGDVVAMKAAGNAIIKHIGANQFSAQVAIDGLVDSGMDQKEARMHYNKIVNGQY